MENKTKHLYIHIPFCKYICTYCDFVRKVPKNQSEVEIYINKIIDEINQLNNIFETVYIGGGTPNYLNDYLLDKLLYSLQKNINDKTEFTIECNPDFINQNQIEILTKNKINRISLGVQTTNLQILKLINRRHTLDDCINAIKLLQQNNITNISCDFIYNLPLLKNSDLDDAIKFCLDNQIKHISFYALEIKEGSILKKKNHQIDLDNEENQLLYLIEKLNKTNYQRYEVSNWSLNNQFKSQHNLAYWLLKDWKSIGYGGYGLEERNYYHIVGDYNNFYKENNILDNKEYYLYILMMGLRLIDGINLSILDNNLAYQYYKEKIDHSLVEIKNNQLKLKNINLLDNLLINLI